MTTDLNIVVESEPKGEVRHRILQSVRDFNDSKSPYHRTIREAGAVVLDVFAYGQNGTLLAGLVGETYWNWLAVDYLWVIEAHRRNGLGSLLLLEAETVAIERKCDWSKVSTFSFQAPNFYLNLGYEVIGELTDYPPGQTLFWLRKQLSKTVNQIASLRTSGHPYLYSDNSATNTKNTIG